MPDSYLKYGELRFVWDEDKNRKNIKKHGISFEIASRVFEDDLRSIAVPFCQFLCEQGTSRTGFYHNGFSISDDIGCGFCNFLLFTELERHMVIDVFGAAWQSVASLSMNDTLFYQAIQVLSQGDIGYMKNICKYMHLCFSMFGYIFNN